MRWNAVECLELKLNPNYNELQYELSYFDFTDKDINDEYINNISNKLEIGNTCVFKLNKNKIYIKFIIKKL